MVNTDMLMGTGNYTRTDGQAGFDPLVQEQCQQTGMAALVQTIQLVTPQESFARILQGVGELFLCFGGQLTAAVEKQVSDPAARKLMLQSLARSNCNAVCKRIIEALPGEPSMLQMVEACARVTPSSQQMVAVATAVQPAVTTVVQPTVSTVVQPAVPAAVQPVVAAAGQPAWIVPQGVHQQQWGARARKKLGRKAQKPTAVLFHCAQCGRPNHTADACKATVHVNGHSLVSSGNAMQSVKARRMPTQMSLPQPQSMEICSSGLQPAPTVQQVLMSAQPSLSTEDWSRGDGGFGSTGPPQVRWTAVLTKDRPQTLCTVSMAGATPSEIHLRGLLDTGADVSILSLAAWPPQWPLTLAKTSISGLGGTKQCYVSQNPMAVMNPEGQTALILPHVAEIAQNLWGRDVLAMCGVRMGTDF
ncbi:hypothetical protein DUI87_21650 [Hirundo rustica rustica]|uniref:Peptidase A2 domain-containing protein n=1 Tax=Hirundo rustica rustica TaxID=333673 RepID=A0A3M0K3N3_HIRRU|nr:hypothetical protein DUI87_21650 [Hirundo rustica rustica]